MVLWIYQLKQHTLSLDSVMNKHKVSISLFSPWKLVTQQTIEPWSTIAHEERTMNRSKREVLIPSGIVQSVYLKCTGLVGKGHTETQHVICLWFGVYLLLQPGFVFRNSTIRIRLRHWI